MSFVARLSEMDITLMEFYYSYRPLGEETFRCPGCAKYVVKHIAWKHGHVCLACMIWLVNNSDEDVG